MKLSELAKKTTAQQPNHSILVYGPPKTGKTRFVGTAAKIPEVKRIFWFDGENGAETLLHMGLSDAEMDKIILIKVPDTRDTPRFIETVLKALTSKTAVTICDNHGKIGCIECKDQGVKFFIKDCTHEDLVVIDSGSQLGDSALNLACIGKDVTFKPGFDEFGAAGKYLTDIFMVMQAATYTNFITITHEMVIEEEVNGVKRDKIYPLVGTRAYCSKVSKYFGTVIYLEIKMNKHAGGSASTYKPNHITGSRLDIKVEQSKELDMRGVLTEGGILK